METLIAPLSLTDIILRIGATFVLALLFGIERQAMRKPIGFGTFTFVATGACVLAITAIRLTPTTPLPLLAAIVTGIGFLGAGALVRTGEKVHGFTSAALIWIFAIFGITIGVGELEIGLAAYILIWIVTLYDRYLENKGSGLYKSKVTITANRIMPEKDIRHFLFDGTKPGINEFQVDRKNNRQVVVYAVEGTRDNLGALTKKLETVDWCESYAIE